jgi:hypothetical protein
MNTTLNDFTTIRISRSLKAKLDSITSKNESYDQILKKVIGSSLAIRAVEANFISELKKKKYVDFDDIEW